MPQTLAEKLADAAAALPELVKRGDNGEYTYLRAVDVVAAVRKELLKRHIVIVPVNVDVTDRQPNVNVTGDVIDEVKVKVWFDVTDGVETIHGCAAGVGQDYKGKALPKAQTGAFKAFLKVLGLIEEVDADPETVNDGPISKSLAKKAAEAEARCAVEVTDEPVRIVWLPECEHLVGGKCKICPEEKRIENAERKKAAHEAARVDSGPY